MCHQQTLAAEWSLPGGYLALARPAPLFERVVGDQAQNLVAGETEGHGPHHARHRADIVKFADRPVDAEPMHARARVEIDHLHLPTGNHLDDVCERPRKTLPTTLSVAMLVPGMTIHCLMGTCGRYALACEALACFLQQSVQSEARLLIYNQHPVPLSFDHPRVRVVNEAPPNGSLRFIRQRMLELADPGGADLVRWWDDDDLFLPWHLEDCLEHIGESVAWKTASSWLSERNEKFTLCRNRFEGSWIFRVDYLRSAPIDTHPTYTDHPVVMQTEEAGLLATTDLGGRTSYIYRWDIGAEHVSGYGASGDEATQEKNLETWRRRSNDVLSDGQLVPADMTLLWQRYLDGTRDKVSPEEWKSNRRRLQRLARFSL